MDRVKTKIIVDEYGAWRYSYTGSFRYPEILSIKRLEDKTGIKNGSN